MLICSVQNKYQVWFKFSVKYDNAVGHLSVICHMYINFSLSPETNSLGLSES